MLGLKTSVSSAKSLSAEDTAKVCRLPKFIPVRSGRTGKWLPRMLQLHVRVQLYYARGAQGLLPMRVGGETSQLDLTFLTPLSVADCG